MASYDPPKEKRAETRVRRCVRIWRGNMCLVIWSLAVMAVLV